MFRSATLLAVLVTGAALGGCASTNNPDSLAQNDPYEPTNRKIFEFNQGLDKHVAAPVAKFYNHAVPEPVRDGIHNVLDNLGKPVTFANDILQGSPDRGLQTFGRFTVNSTLGLGGLVDVATKMGIPDHDEDFGQTLGVWGSGEGPYLVMPFLGPAPPRDLAGKVADNFLDPFTYMRFDGYWTFTYVRAGMGVLDLRARHVEDLEAIERSSVDYYATQRSLYRQFRNSEIRNGTPDSTDLPDL
ncbi:MAG: VacJ family lipoprotein [Alphaproteobacteria bacterium]|nr:VacJ family lipoprotein [Alphaproteobacteria bacterium]